MSRAATTASDAQKKVLKAAEQHRPDVVLRRDAWRVQQAGLNPEKLVFLDETWVKTNMTRQRGRAPCGARLVAYAPHGHWKTTTFLAGLRVSGITAPLVIDGTLNGELFLRYIEQHLAPTLTAGDIVIMDNLAAHKVAGVNEALTAVGAQVMYLPPYSPDFNPIEQAFAKFKHLMRSAAERTVETLWQRCGQVLAAFTESECRNYLRHSGYRYV